MASISLSWNQVHAWRLSQHYLSARLRRQDFIQAVADTGGIQAQVASAAELALWARANDLTPQDVQSALWQERTLIKTWAMRGTLHLIAASELPLYVAARSQHDPISWIKYFTYYGVTQVQYEAFIAAAPQILSNEPITREQFADAVAEHVGSAELGQLVLTKGWGTPLKPLAWRGDLCFGPNQGRNVTFVNPSQWVGTWQSIDPQLARQEIVRRYLRVYGPATVEDFVRWWDGGSGIMATRKLFLSIKDELVDVDVEGWQAVALRTSLEQLQERETIQSVHLLPLFDVYTLGLGRDLESLLPKAYKSRVFRPQGWISAVVLVDGAMQGVWEHTSRATQTIIKVHMFASPSVRVRDGIAAEADRLAAFLNTNVTIAYG